MILEGFEIENWACIKKVSVSALPPTGVIVLHGPNRTGKSSIVQALRACLMDYASTSKALSGSYPRGTGEKPIVSVDFRVGNTTYRVKKYFGTNKSEFASKTTTGAWKAEPTSASEAHERTCALAGGNKSTMGLQQLLWLTQAEFDLPKAKDLDVNVQSRLRDILGVLQTPLDNRFIESVKKRWNAWFSGQRKSDKQPQIKDGCKLAENLKRLGDIQAELKESESKFNDVEGLLRQANNLELLKFDLSEQLKGRADEFKKVKEEREKCKDRIRDRLAAEKDHAAAAKEESGALKEQQDRSDAVKRLRDEEKDIEPANSKVANADQLVTTKEEELGRQRKSLATLREQRRQLQNRQTRIAEVLRSMDDTDALRTAHDNLERARGLAVSVAALKKFLTENPSTSKKELDSIKANRQRASQLQAEREAASMNLTLAAENRTAAVQLAIDGGPARQVEVTPAQLSCPVRRKAELSIAGWGRVEFSRGTDMGSLDEIEQQLRECEDEFANAVTPLGVAASDSDVLDQVLRRDAEHQLKTPQLDEQSKQLKKLAPKGLESLETSVLHLQAKLKTVPSSDISDSESLPIERSELHELAASLKKRGDGIDDHIKRQETDITSTETELNVLKANATAAREQLATAKAKAESSVKELGRLNEEEVISGRIAKANRAFKEAEVRLKETELTAAESTIDQRVTASEDAVSAIEGQIRETDEKYNRIKGRLEASEGLHAQRSSLAARADELIRITERESLGKDAVDRLYALFEECREKQLGTLMGPIHDRVLSWMRLLDIGDYKEMRFSDAFLPEKLMSRDGTAEFTVDEESTDAQEQICMLVRLALGSTLSSAAEPAVAILDDPLTHCDIGRLNKMRFILRRAAEGDPLIVPAAGPLQIVILTCHPEWFRGDGAKVIDLESADVMSRYPV